MTEQWQFQIRITLDDAHAALARHDPATPALQALTAVLVRHDASLKSQYDAFADYLAEAEREGVEQYALYKWTKQTLDDPARPPNTPGPSRCASPGRRCMARRWPTRWRRICGLCWRPGRSPACPATTPTRPTTCPSHPSTGDAAPARVGGRKHSPSGEGAPTVRLVS